MLIPFPARQHSVERHPIEVVYGNGQTVEEPGTQLVLRVRREIGDEVSSTQLLQALFCNVATRDARRVICHMEA